MTSLALLQDLVSSLALPQRTGTLASLPRAGELLVFAYGGFLDLTAGLTAGYELIGHQGLTLRDLSTVIDYGLRLKASVNVGFKLGGNFEIASRLGSDPHSVRLTVKKARAFQADFAAAFQADAIAAVKGLPGTADEFLSALLGADVRRALEIFQKIRADADLDTLQKDVDRILSKMVVNIANKWIGRALDQVSLKPFQEIVGKVVDDYRGVDQRLANTVVHLYQDYAAQGTVDRLTAALRKIIALHGRDDLARLDDADAWKLLGRLGGNLTTLLSDDGALGEVQKVAQTALDFAEGRWQPRLRDLVDELKAQFDLDQLFGQLTQSATKDALLRLTDTTLQGVVERLLGMAWEKIKTSDVGKAAAELKAALDRVETFKETWYAKLGDALHQQFSLTANYAFTRATADDALIDVEIDVSTPAGQKLFETAARGRFTEVFDPANLGLLRVHRGVLTHQLTDSARIRINVLEWSEKQLVQVISRTANSIEVQPTGLVNVFTTEASVKQRVERKGYELESQFLIGLAGDATQAASTARGKHDGYLIETLRKIGVSYNLAVSDKVTTTAELSAVPRARRVPAADSVGERDGRVARHRVSKGPGRGHGDLRRQVRIGRDLRRLQQNLERAAQGHRPAGVALSRLRSPHQLVEPTQRPGGDGICVSRPGERGAVRPAGIHGISRRQRDRHDSGVVHEGRGTAGAAAGRRLHPPAARDALRARAGDGRRAGEAGPDDRRRAKPSCGRRRGRSRDGGEKIRQHLGQHQHLRHDQHVLRDLRRLRPAERWRAARVDVDSADHPSGQSDRRDEIPHEPVTSVPNDEFPGVNLEEAPAGVHPIAGVSTATTAFIGWSPQGHTEVAVEVENLREFAQEFGEPDARSLLGHAVRQFFDNGGTHAWIVRLSAAPAVVLTPDTEPFERLLLPASGAGGAFLLDRVNLVNLLCVPGETTPAVITALQVFCVARRIFLLVDAPPGPLPFAPDARVIGEGARNSAMYLPWMLPADPGTSKIHAFPPCGFVAGVYSRTDRTRGVWKAPAGLEATIIGAAGPAMPVTDRDAAALTEHGVNAIRSFADHVVVWGSRTLAGGAASASDWKYVPVRRFALFLEESVHRGIAWAAFEPNAEPLWAQIRASVTTFLIGLFRQGAFAGNTANTSFYVRCGTDTMTADEVAAGTLNIDVGFAPLKPSEFVIIRIGGKAGTFRT